MVLTGKYRNTFLAFCTALSVAVPFHVAEAATLKQALETAYQHNPLLRSERESLKATDENASQAFSGWLPTASFTKSIGDERATVGARPESSDHLDNDTLQVTQPLFQGGRTIANMKRAKHQIVSGQASLRDREQRVLLESVTAYMDVLRDTKVLNISKNNEEVLRKHLEATKDRFDLGEVTRTDVAQAEARLSRATTDRIVAFGNLEASRATYKRVIGEEPVDLVYPKELPVIPGTLEEVMKVSLEQNPLLLEQIQNVKVAKYEVNALEANILPKVTFDIISRRDEGGVNFGGVDVDTDQFLVNAQVPLYQSGAEYSRVRQAKQTEKSREYFMNDTRNTVVENAIRAWEQFNVAESTIVSSEDTVRANRVALDGVQQEADVGSRTTLDVLDAEQELFVARTNVIRAKRDKAVANYALLSVMGGLHAKSLGLEVPVYDPLEHYQKVRFQPIGLSAD